MLNTPNEDNEHTHDVKNGSIRLHAREFARAAVVDRVYGYEVWKQPWVPSAHPAERCVVQFCPRAVYDSDTLFLDDVSTKQTKMYATGAV